MQMDRQMACALTEAGYMPLAEYIAMFGDDVAAEVVARKPAKRPVTLGEHRSRPWGVPAHFASPLRAAKFRVRYQRIRTRA
jgi:hypothetical protein